MSLPGHLWEDVYQFAYIGRKVIHQETGTPGIVVIKQCSSDYIPQDDDLFGVRSSVCQQHGPRQHEHMHLAGLSKGRDTGQGQQQQHSAASHLQLLVPIPPECLFTSAIEGLMAPL